MIFGHWMLLKFFYFFFSVPQYAKYIFKRNKNREIDTGIEKRDISIKRMFAIFISIVWIFISFLPSSTTTFLPIYISQCRWKKERKKIGKRNEYSQFGRRQPREVATFYFSLYKFCFSSREYFLSQQN
jgi:hypothetical protein